MLNRAQDKKKGKTYKSNSLTLGIEEHKQIMGF